MSSPETRAGAQTADSSAAADARAEREARMEADIRAMQAGPVEHTAEMTSHHQGQPSVETQMVTHGAVPPSVPDTGGHG